MGDGPAAAGDDGAWGDDALDPALADDLRQAFLQAPPTALEDQHVAAMIGAAGVPASATGGRRLWAAALVAVVAMAAFGGMAQAGALPGPVQDTVSSIASVVGIEIPDAEGDVEVDLVDDRPGTSENGPGNSENAPGHDENGPGNSENAPGHGGSPPGKSGDTPAPVTPTPPNQPPHPVTPTPPNQPPHPVTPTPPNQPPHPATPTPPNEPPGKPNVVGTDTHGGRVG